jgi:hypothetical protein
MTEAELLKSFGDFNSRYFGGRLNCKVIITDDWIDADEKYYADSSVKQDKEMLGSGTAAGVSVRRATPLYTHSKDLIRIPRWMLAGEKPPRQVLLHEMAHSAANEPETDHRSGTRRCTACGKRRRRSILMMSRQALQPTNY